MIHLLGAVPLNFLVQRHIFLKNFSHEHPMMSHLNKRKQNVQVKTFQCVFKTYILFYDLNTASIVRKKYLQ